jgi:predicted transcriptional regulator
VSEDGELQKIVGQVAAAYFSNSHVMPSEISTVISHIAHSLLAVGGPAPEAPAEAVAPPKLTPAQIRKSITREALISFEDNKPYKTLRRHLAVRGLTPDDYKGKWGLPKDYPMVAPAYSEARSSMAKALGLGSRVAASTPKAERTTTPRVAKASAPKAAAKGRRGAQARTRKPRAVSAKARNGEAG